MKHVQVSALVLLSSAIMAAAAPVVPSTSSPSDLARHVKRDVRTSLAKWLLNSKSETELGEKKEAKGFTGEQIMNYFSMGLATLVLPAYAYGRWTNLEAIQNFDEVKRLQKLAAARRAGEQDAAQKAAAAASSSGKKGAGQKQGGAAGGAEHDSSLGGSLNGRSIDDDAEESGSLEVRNNNELAGGSSRGGEDDGRLHLFTKYEQVAKEKARLELEQQQLREQFSKVFGAHSLGDKAFMDSLNLNSITNEATKAADKAVETVVPKHPRIDKTFAALGLTGAVLGIAMAADSAWKGKHYLDGSKETLRDAKATLPPGIARRSADDADDALPARAAFKFRDANGQDRPVFIVSREAH